MSVDVKKLTEKIKKEHVALDKIRKEIAKVVVGQSELVDGLIMSILCNHHVLIEGVPGVAKTLTVTTLAQTLDCLFQRIQFTPDMLPADVVGTMIYNPKTAEFTPKKGPIFSNIVLADEINRAPAKVQSALLEAMQERQVTLGDDTYKLDEPFMVLATQNPVEQEGTYQLPEAQVDRFMMKLIVGYPTKGEELQVMRRMASSTLDLSVDTVIHPDDIIKMRNMVDKIYVDPKVEEYVVNLIDCTRNPENYGLDLANMIRMGASPRATIYLTMAARAHAFINGRGYVSPQDIKSVAMNILRHRVLVSYEAEAEEKNSIDIIQTILDTVEVP